MVLFLFHLYSAPSLFLFSLCHSIPQTLRLCLLCNIPVLAGREKKKIRDFPPQTRLFFTFFFYIPLYIVLKGNLLFRSGIKLRILCKAQVLVCTHWWCLDSMFDSPPPIMLLYHRPVPAKIPKRRSRAGE